MSDELFEPGECPNLPHPFDSKCGLCGFQRAEPSVEIPAEETLRERFRKAMEAGNLGGVYDMVEWEIQLSDSLPFITAELQKARAEGWVKGADDQYGYSERRATDPDNNPFTARKTGER